MKSEEDKVMQALTSYRLIPAMYRVLTAGGDIFFHATKELAKVFGIKSEEVKPLLESYKHRIIYAMQDFRHYADLIQPPSFIDSYWPAMEEEASLIVDTAPFATGIDHATIFDIGAGSMPYLNLFKMMNQGLNHYVGMDKHYDGTFKPPVYGVPVSVLQGTYEVLLATSHIYCDVLFLGNFLHCLSDIEEFFDFVLPKLVNLKMIKILELKPNTPLDFLFDYHMYQHCKGQRITEEVVEEIFAKYGDTWNIASLGDYHTMYTIKL